MSSRRDRLHVVCLNNNVYIKYLLAPHIGQERTKNEHIFSPFIRNTIKHFLIIFLRMCFSCRCIYSPTYSKFCEKLQKRWIAHEVA